MDIDEFLKTLIDTYPIKEPDKYSRSEWVIRNTQKHEYLRLMEDGMFNLACDRLNIHYPERNYKLAVGCLFGLCFVPGKAFGEMVSSYYLRSGIMFGLPTKNSFKFLFEVDCIYKKDGKFLTITPEYETRKPKLIHAATACIDTIKEIYKC